ncbi:hypothetical protein PO883_08905 [Massilia sp. DJPM01]|uniref:hypothetical protein n=1 Tax=Massilia sp. DJPM01 TaxID=3024404 RepID=UPI00259E931F|nr:hypothetical protein [Massilia sp. DJPM01]MDM5177311.1 hypothetical protein [Massilia sp. DJPM01]
MKIVTTLLIPAALLLGANASAQKFENLAATPQMGWNSWNKFACNIDEKLIRETADAMVRTPAPPPAAGARAAAVTNTRMRSPTPPGASITSSTTGAIPRA